MNRYRRTEHLDFEIKTKLRDLWKKLSTEDLIWLVIHSDQESVQRKAWKKFKASGKLTLTDIYDLEASGPEFIQKELLQIFLEEAGSNSEALLEAMDCIPSFFESAEKKLFSLIKQKKLSEGQAKHILTKIIERIPPSRQKAFLQFKKLNPSHLELLRIRDMEFIESDPAMLAMVEKLIRTVAKKNGEISKSKKVKRIIKLEGRFQETKEKQLKKSKKEQN